jgi:hypothetical protein
VSTEPGEWVQLPEAIDDGADAALAAESGVIGVMAGDDASVDGVLGVGLMALLAEVSGAGVVVALGAGVSEVFEQPASENTAAKATAEIVVRVGNRVIVSSCPVGIK